MIQQVKQAQGYNWGRYITDREWEALGVKGRENVVLDLQERGLKLQQSYRADGSKLIVCEHPTRAEAFAEYERHRYIDRTEWDALTTEEKSRARNLLAARGLAPYETVSEYCNSPSVTLIPLADVGQPVTVYAVNRDYEFTASGDSRVPGCEEVTFVVHNSPDVDNAALKLQLFLDALRANGAVAFDETEDEADEQEADFGDGLEVEDALQVA